MAAEPATKPIVFGAAYSVYVRSVRLTLVEKGVAYDLVEAGTCSAILQDRAAQRRRHPFGKIPAFAHGDFQLYETGAIERYVDEAFAGPPLQPRDLVRRARMNQALSVLDNYALTRNLSGAFTPSG